MARRTFSWWTLGLLVLLGGVLAFCNRKSDGVEPTAPKPGDSTSVNRPDSVTGVQILSMSIAGIPKEAITINQAMLEIEVKMPATVTNDILKPALTLTDDAELATNGVYILESWCSCCLPTSIKSQFGLRKKGNPSGSVKYYTVHPIPTGELAPAPLAAPLEYAIDNDNPLSVPFVNLYGNDLPTSATLTKKGSSQLITLSAKNGKITCAYQPSNLSLYLYGQPLTVGNYAVAFQWENGRTLSLSQPLVIKKGAAQLSSASRWFGFTAVRGVGLAIEGKFLLKEETSLQLKSLSGQVIPLPTTAFQADGQKLTMTVPETVPLGVYLLQLLQDGKVVECHRLSVRTDAKPQLAIATITSAYVSPVSGCSLTEPISVERAKATEIFYSSTTPSAQTSARLLLTSLADSSKQITVPIATSQVEAAPKFTLPATTEPGRYRASLQLVTPQTGQVIDSSGPFERVVEVK